MMPCLDLSSPGIRVMLRLHGLVFSLLRWLATFFQGLLPKNVICIGFWWPPSIYVWLHASPLLCDHSAMLLLVIGSHRHHAAKF